jgi:hypothetical protein
MRVCGCRQAEVRLVQGGGGFGQAPLRAQLPMGHLHLTWMRSAVSPPTSSGASGRR